MNNSRFITINQVETFSNRLSGLDVNNLGLVKYQASYLINLLKYKNYFVRIYANILNELLQYSPKEKEDIFIIDYGAGNGLLGLFAKYCGFGKIVQIDTSPDCCFSQQMLSKKLGLPVYENINGDFELLEKFASAPPDALIATDVIEHIYDLNKFFSMMQKLNKQLITVFTTASNDQNWWKKIKLMKVQKTDEWKGHVTNNGKDVYESFRKIRTNIIKSELTHITYSELRRLVTHTRGLRKEDIIVACGLYKEKGTMPPLILHPTNTCDPVSGSWTERFLSFREYHELYNKYGFSLIIKNGFYNEYQGGIKGKILKMLNIIIKNAGKKGSVVSPFIILIGK